MFHVKHQIECERILRTQGIILSDVQRECLSMFVAYVLEWNQKINLLSRKDEENIWFSHILHSLTPLMYIEWRPGWKVLDLGTGGGFPGVPLAILMEDVGFTLVDSTQKKITALRDIVSRVGIKNIELVASRAEDLSKRKEYSRQYDVVVARAVASLVELVGWSRPFLKKEKFLLTGERSVKRLPTKPFLLAMKGGDLVDEIHKTEVRRGVDRIELIDIVFDGSVEIGLEEKKLVIVERE
jgi:16S rRNA (guanine527-N7)-methyltransferase